MERFELTKKQLQKLREYGLEDFPLADVFGVKFSAGEIFLREGMPAEYLLIVLRGKAKVCRDSIDGKELILSYYISDGILGEEELMTDDPLAHNYVIALTDFYCIALSLKNNRKALKENCRFVNTMARELAGKLKRSDERYFATALYSAEKRLCSYILQIEKNNCFTEVLTEVAATVGISYRHLHRLMRQLSEEGILYKKGRNYEIVDRQRLMEKLYDEAFDQDKVVRTYIDSGGKN